MNPHGPLGRRIKAARDAHMRVSPVARLARHLNRPCVMCGRTACLNRVERWTIA